MIRRESAATRNTLIVRFGRKGQYRGPELKNCLEVRRIRSGPFAFNSPSRAPFIEHCPPGGTVLRRRLHWHNGFDKQPRRRRALCSRNEGHDLHIASRPDPGKNKMIDRQSLNAGIREHRLDCDRGYLPLEIRDYLAITKGVKHRTRAAWSHGCGGAGTVGRTSEWCRRQGREISDKVHLEARFCPSMKRISQSRGCQAMTSFVRLHLPSGHLVDGPTLR